jgi:protease-4
VETNKKNKQGFSQRHPLVFGLTMFTAVAAILLMAVAAVRHWTTEGGLFPGDRIARVWVQGMILDSEFYTEWLERLEADTSVKAVVLRINSPGGAVAPSQEINAAVARLARTKPVVASMADMAASGGYYVACAADTVIANPATLTASIGVLAELVDLTALAGKLGIGQTQITSGPYKGAGSPLTPLTDKQKAQLKNIVMDLHEQFVADVAAGRDMPLEAVRALADGRAMTGRQAQEAGLVDELGGMFEALEKAKAMAGISGPVDIVEGPPEEESLLGSLLGVHLHVDPAQAAAWLAPVLTVK